MTTNFVDVLITTACSGVIFACVYSLYKAFQALRAQDRFMKKLEQTAPHDPNIRKFQEIADEHLISIDQLDSARVLIRDLARTLSEQDKRLLETGLDQDSSGGKQRYISNLLSSGARRSKTA